MALVPSLGCCLYAASPTELEPDGVFAVPPATRIFPKRGIIQASAGPARAGRGPVRQPGRGPAHGVCW